MQLLREEMRRTLRFLQWRSEWWRARETSWEGLHPETAEGLRAYALRQAHLHDAIARKFKDYWDREGVELAKEAAEEDMIELGDSILA